MIAQKSRNKKFLLFVRVSNKGRISQFITNYTKVNGDAPDVYYVMNQQHDDHSSCGFLDHVSFDQGDDYWKQ